MPGVVLAFGPDLHRAELHYQGRRAAEHGVIIVAPDTSPRGNDVPDSPDYDLGQGAGFYVNATQAPWATHFRVYDYVVSELPALIEAEFAASDARSISGHSMGWHGALVVALRNPGRYRSVSAFSPIVAPSEVPWGKKAFAAYLGDNRNAGRDYDAVELIGHTSERLPLLVDQGDDASAAGGKRKGRVSVGRSEGVKGSNSGERRSANVRPRRSSESRQNCGT